MKLTNIRLSCRARGVICVLTMLALVLGATPPTSAQWRAVDAQNAWAAFQTHFVHLEADGYSKIFNKTQDCNCTTHEGFWTYAEELEVAEDAYYENPTTANKNLVEALCDGFVNDVHPATGDLWTSDLYNDDLGVAIIAFARAYSITGTTRWLSAAENNFNAVWTRGRNSVSTACTVNGICNAGMCEYTGTCYENSSANWTFVIAGNLLYNITGTTSYQTEKDGVYTWAKANLYNSTTGEIYDGPSPGQNVDYSYNYGYAMIAGSYQGSNVMVPAVATYAFNSMANATYPYDGTYGGYNVMPDYGQGDLNDSGFNGILMRGVRVANGYGYIPSAVMLAAQANINAAWSFRNGTTTLVWNDWDLATPSTGTYSWDDSAAMAGLVNLPPTAN